MPKTSSIAPPPASSSPPAGEHRPAEPNRDGFRVEPTDHEARETGLPDDGLPSASALAAAQGHRIQGIAVPAGMARRTGTGAGSEIPPEAALPEETASAESDSVIPANNEAEESEEGSAPAGDPLNCSVASILDRVSRLVPGRVGRFVPKRPASLADAGLTAGEVEKLVLKLLSARGVQSGRQIAANLRLPFGIIEQILKMLRAQVLVQLRGNAEAGDYEFQLTDPGRARAAEYSRECSYFGSAPVCLADYLDAMAAQSIAKQEVCPEDLERAFGDLILNRKLLDKLGPAINSGRGMFLFGEPGNGKTSIAERITATFSSTIWIPRTLGLDGDFLRVYDPGVHKAIDDDPPSSSLIDTSEHDQRWVQIQRPTVVVGGELTMADLEVTQNPISRVCESPVQLKSNCGTLVIDDFGRQRMPVAELLNRWIVPLEKRYDFLNLPSGRKIQVPFDQLIIFSTNLEPRDLVDGAFLRRIPYKIQVPDPTREEFHQLFERLSPHMGFEYDRRTVDYLIETHFAATDRQFRSCHPRDLLLQVRNYCTYRRLPRKMSPDAFDFAVENYFSVL